MIRFIVIFAIYILQANSGSAQCNGSNSLCSKPFNEVAFLTTHNAFNTQSEGYTFPNQNYSLTQQLNEDVRGLMLDVYNLSGIPTVYHGSSLLGNQPLSSILTDIKQFLDTNPNEILTIIFECYVTSIVIENAMIDAGLDSYLYSKPNGGNWNTLQEMINLNKRLVIFTDVDDASAGQEWYHYAWDHCVETHFTVNNIGAFDNDYNRGSAQNDLFIFNHFITDQTFGIGSQGNAAIVNEFNFLMPRIQQHFNEKGKFPNFITLDFYDLGMGKEVVDSLNSASFVIGIDELVQEEIQIDPNPCKDFVTIKNFNTKLNFEVLIYSLLGEKQIAFNSDFQSEITLDLNLIKSGIYIVQIKNNFGSISNQRLIVN